MTVVGFLIDNVSNNGQSVRAALSALMGYAPSGRPLGASSGVRPGTPSSTGSVTSSTWSIGPHAGILDLEVGATVGPYCYAVIAAEGGNIPPASSSNPRIDLVTIRTNDPTVDSSSIPSVTTQYYPGTPASSPSTPATPAGEYALMTISVPKSGTGAPSSTWLATPWDDSGPVTLTPTSNYSAGTAAVAQQAHGRVYLDGIVNKNGTSTISTSTPETVATLPAGITPPPRTVRQLSGSGGAIVYVQINAGSTAVTAVVASGSTGTFYLSNINWPLT